MGKGLVGEFTVVGELERHVRWHAVGIVLLDELHEGIVEDAVAEAGEMDAVREDL